MPSLGLIPATVDDFRDMAERRLPRLLFDYVDGGAGSEETLRANVSALSRTRLKQRVLRDVSQTSTEVEVLGEKMAMPLILAPVGMAGMMARRAEVIAKRVADSFGLTMTLSTNSICPIEEVAQVSERPLWFQLYMLRDRGVVRELLARAWANGVRTLVFTVDLSVIGMRYRDMRNGFYGEVGTWGKLRSGPVDYLLHPRWLWDVALRGGPHLFGNLTGYAPGARSPADFKDWVDTQFDASVSWKDIEWLRGEWQGKLVLKGILDPADACEAAATGADGIVVSNHGGRQLDGVPATVEVLPRIADKLAGTTIIIVDGGIRCGQDAVKVMALGAQAAMIGRPWIYALAAQGERGLERYLRLFAMDMRSALGLSGCPDAKAINRDVLFDSQLEGTPDLALA